MLRDRLAAVILTAFAMGCAAEQAPLEPDPALEPAFNLTNGPATAGPFVIRSAGQFAWVATDPARDLVSINGLGAVDPASSVFCTGTGSSDVWSIQEVIVTLGSGSPTDRALLLGRNNTQHVYSGILAFYSEPDFCAAIQRPRLAQGRGNLSSFDNGLWGADPGSHSFGWAAEGVLEDLVNGGQVHYSEEQRAVFLPDGTFKGWLVENILLHHIGS